MGEREVKMLTREEAKDYLSSHITVWKLLADLCFLCGSCISYLNFQTS